MLKRMPPPPNLGGGLSSYKGSRIIMCVCRLEGEEVFRMQIHFNAEGATVKRTVKAPNFDIDS